jgi:hypothetical protein
MCRPPKPTNHIPVFFRLKFYSYQDINLYSLFFLNLNSNLNLLLLYYFFIFFSRGFEIAESYCFAMVKEKDYLMNDYALFDVRVFSFLMYYPIISTLVI